MEGKKSVDILEGLSVTLGSFADVLKMAGDTPDELILRMARTLNHEIELQIREINKKVEQNVDK